MEPRDATLNAAISAMVDGIGWLWIGIRRNASKPFKWVLDDDDLTYKSWFPGEPSHKQIGGDCVAGGHDDGWSNYGCSIEMHYVCQISKFMR